MDKCSYGMVMDTCVQRSAKTNELYRYRMFNGGLFNIVEKKSLNVGDYFKHENRIYEVLQEKDSYGSHKVKCVLYRFAKPYSKCEFGNDEMVYGGWLYKGAASWQLTGRSISETSISRSRPCQAKR